MRKTLGYVVGVSLSWLVLDGLASAQPFLDQMGERYWWPHRTEMMCMDYNATVHECLRVQNDRRECQYLYREGASTPETLAGWVARGALRNALESWHSQDSEHVVTKYTPDLTTWILEHCPAYGRSYPR